MTWRRCHGGIGTRRRLGGQTLAGRFSSSVRAVVNKGRKVGQGGDFDAGSPRARLHHYLRWN